MSPRTDGRTARQAPIFPAVVAYSDQGHCRRVSERSRAAAFGLGRENEFLKGKGSTLRLLVATENNRCLRAAGLDAKFFDQRIRLVRPRCVFERDLRKCHGFVQHPRKTERDWMPILRSGW